MTQHPTPQKVEGTTRLEAFSDGVMAIIVTLLIFELHVPQLPDLSSQSVLNALWVLSPKLISFGVSFFTVAIYWVNHHHFFTRITHTDWKLLWANNLLLFWLTIVPFTTAFIGDYPTQPLVVALYALVLGLAGMAFALMGYYAFFVGQLIAPTVSLPERRREYARAWIGTGLYLASALIAFIYVYAALFILAVIPLSFVVPTLMQAEE
jgi:uncharacterized membrane protein